MKKIFINCILLVIGIILMILLFNNYRLFDAPEIAYVRVINIGDNFYRFENISDFSSFDIEYQKLIDSQIEKLLKKTYKFDEPLMILNPYGTNTCGVNIYFNTKEELEISYVVSVDKERISDFSRVLKNDSEDNFTKVHRYQIIGLIPGEINYLKLVGTNRNGDRQEMDLIVDMTSVECEAPIILGINDGESVEELEDGLFVVFAGGKPNDIYDNSGVLRASLALEYEQCYRIIFHNGEMFYKYGENIIGVIDRLGRIKKKYIVPTHRLHHDYVFDEDNMKMISLATSYDEQESRIGDFIVVIDLISGEVDKVIDMKDLLPEMYKIARDSYGDRVDFNGQGMDWIHVNSLSLVER